MARYSAGVHGNALQLQDPLHVMSGPHDALTTRDEPVATIRRLGWGTEIRGNRWPAWVHFVLPIASRTGAVTVNEIHVQFSTEFPGAGVLTAIHAWDGHLREWANDAVSVPPLVDQGGNRIRADAQAYVHVETFSPFFVNRMALGISVQCTFATAIHGDRTSGVTFHRVMAWYEAGD